MNVQEVTVPLARYRWPGSVPASLLQIDATLTRISVCLRCSSYLYLLFKVLFGDELNGSDRKKNCSEINRNESQLLVLLFLVINHNLPPSF